nr:protein FAR1-RELATED SEQUENCE 5-like [Ipomoea batatas]
MCFPVVLPARFLGYDPRIFGVQVMHVLRAPFKGIEFYNRMRQLWALMIVVTRIKRVGKASFVHITTLVCASRVSKELRLSFVDVDTSSGMSVGKSGVVRAFGGVLTFHVVVHPQTAAKNRVLGSGSNRQKSLL